MDDNTQFPGNPMMPPSDPRSPIYAQGGTVQRMLQAKAPWANVVNDQGIPGNIPGAVAYKGAHPSQDQGFQVSAPNGDKVILSKDEYANYMKDKDNFWFDYDDGRHISR